MKKLEEKGIKTERIYRGSLLRLRKDIVELPSGRQSTREIVEHPGAVAIVAITKDEKMVLVKQFRKAVGRVLLEVPAGVPKKGESGEDCARRELEEETGFHAQKVKKIWQGYASPGYSTELIQYYLAEDLKRFKPRAEEDELIEVELMSIDQCIRMLKTGKIKDNKTMIGVMLAWKITSKTF